MDILIPVLSTAIGIVIGATVQFIFNRRQKKDDEKSELKREAYLDYLRGVVLLAHARRAGQETDTRNALSELTEAKLRITAYGSPGVIHAVANFERSGSKAAQDEDKLRFVQIVRAMREEFSLRYASDSEVQEIIFGTRSK